MFVAISAAGAFRTDDAGENWQPINRGPPLRRDPRHRRRGRALRAPHRHAPVPAGDAVHAEALGRHAQRRCRRQSWREISGNLPTDFGFPIAVHAHEPETIYVVPIKSDSEHYPPEGKLRVYRSRTGGRRVGAADQWPAAGKLLCQRATRRDGRRHPRSVRDLLRHHRRPGLRLADGGDTWTPIVRDLPAVLSVEVQVLPMIRVVLPAHLKNLARTSGEVSLDLGPPVTQRACPGRVGSQVPDAARDDSGSAAAATAGRSSASTPAKRTCPTSRRRPTSRSGDQR